MLVKKRYDYFLIWGHGLAYKDRILDIVRNKKSIKVVKILDFKPKNITKFVKTIYSHDYAPLHHLKAKTLYLLKTDPKVRFLFVLNENAQEVFRGEGAFCHIECDYIKAIKKELRNKFNPRVENKRTQNHVIHASDNELQTDHVLKYLGFKEGIKYLKNKPNPVLDCPHYLPSFDEFLIKNIHSDQIYCSILRGNRNYYWTEIKKIQETPHYKCLTGNAKPYKDYLREFIGGPLTCDYSISRLMELSLKLSYLNGRYQNSYIVVKRRAPKKYVIWDGVHRACILRFRGKREFPVVVVE